MEGNKGNTQRQHSCPECQNKKLGPLRWEKHVREYQKKLIKDWQKEHKKKHRELLGLDKTERKFSGQSKYSCLKCGRSSVALKKRGISFSMKKGQIYCETHFKELFPINLGRQKPETKIATKKMGWISKIRSKHEARK